MASNEDARAVREAKLDELHEKLTGAVEALVSGDDWRQALAFAARFRSRSFNNTMLIWVQHEAAFEAGRVPEPFPTLVAGYRQWQSLGRQVMKGQAGYMIFAPVTGRFATATPSDAGSWRRLGPREKPKAGEVVRSRMVGARPAYVWDASQTDGEPLPVTPTPTLLEQAASNNSARAASQDGVDLDRFMQALRNPGLIVAGCPARRHPPRRHRPPPWQSLAILHFAAAQHGKRRPGH